MKLASITLVSAIALALAACSGGSEQPAAAASESGTAADAATDTATDGASDGATDAASDAASEAASATPTPSASASAAAKPGEAKPAPAVSVASVEPPASYARCQACHTPEKGGENGLGPNLFGVFGKPAGIKAGFNYSDALKQSGLTWNEANLDKWLENPRALVPGNRMSFPGMKDAAKRKELIDWMKANS